jgi:hypothetical protein
MDELTVFRNFRCDVAAPSDDARRRARAVLTAAIDSAQGPAPRVVQPIKGRPGRAVLAFAALAAASAVALFVTSPWGTSPGGILKPAQAALFLERAEAALTQPAGTVLHFKAEWSRTSTTFGCTITSPNEMWIDQASPHGWRRISADNVPASLFAADARTVACSEWGTHELGGDGIGGNDAAGQPTFVGQLEFVPPKTLRPYPVSFSMTTADPIAFIRGVLRQAIESGRANDEGMTEIDGRAVRRFRLDCPPPDPRFVFPCARPEYLYMDPETFLPVEWDSPASFTFGNPVTGEYLRFDIVWRYLAIEYLPRTDDNLALTDIRAQHPDAIER